MPIYQQNPSATDFRELAPAVDAHITPERVLKYLKALADTPAPSTTASFIRTPILRSLLDEDGVLGYPNVEFHANFRGTGNAVVLTGSEPYGSGIWYLAHLDTLSYLIQSRKEDVYPLIPFGYHLAEDGAREAEVLRFDPERRRYQTAAHGTILTRSARPFFKPESTDTPPLAPGDRVIYTASLRHNPSSHEITGHLDNAGAVAALAVAARVLADANVPAVIAFPDEEEGPEGSGNFIIGRGGVRLLEHFSTPRLVVVGDVQQAGGDSHLADTRGGAENTTRLGRGAVLAEFSSLGRGAVTPPHLYVFAKQLLVQLRAYSVDIQESNNAYTSRSDDVSAVLKTPNVLLLGFPGFNRHFDRGLPQGNLMDLVNLSKAFVYYALLLPILEEFDRSYE